MITTDQILNKELTFYQYKKGYRFSIDSPLLASFVFEEKKKLTYLDIGTGIAVIPIILNYFDRNNKINKVYGVELQKELFDLAIKNIEVNNSRKVEIINGDINNINTILDANSIDIVFSNPPYYKVGNGRISPNIQKSIAKHELKLNLKQIIDKSNYLLKANGKLKLIYPIERFFDLTQILLNKKFGISKIVFIHPLKNKASKLFLIEAIKGTKVETEILPPIIIHKKNQKYIKNIEELLFEGKQLKF